VRLRSAKGGGRKTDMTRLVHLILGLALVLATSGAQAQITTPTPPLQSLRPSQSLCGASSQSVRVCNDDFRSCNSTCAAIELDPSGDITGCSLKCCNLLKACLSIRGCASPTLDCF
jgi:hypothetical protein